MLHVIDLNFQGIKNSIAAFLVETSDGPVLIETGPNSTLSHLQAGIEAAGYDITDISHVLLSHIHLDHAGAAGDFAALGATIHVHPNGLRHLANPSRLMDSARRIYKDQMDRLWGEMKAIPENQLNAVEDGAVIRVGEEEFIAHHTPGHAVHHIAWQWGANLFSGDVAGVRINQGICVPPCPPPDIHVEDWQESIKKIRAIEPEVLYLTHYGQVTDIDRHLEELENRLLDWANWMKPYFLKGEALDVITPLFQAYVKEELIKTGIDADGLVQYESANPSWMSVAGLMRYWKKHTERS
ncbi:MAG: MBL fold metallo-hydrolase [Bacteroidota bacterium]